MRNPDDSGSGSEAAAIVVEGLSKRYRPRSGASAGGAEQLSSSDLWTPGPKYEPLDETDDGDADADDDERGADEAAEWVAPTRTWALEDVSFQVAPGEAFGVIGPPQAGKTTLLKVLARIVQPSDGRVTLRGRVAPLLGFAERILVPDLDVRRNVRLLVTLLGWPGDLAGRMLPEILSFTDLRDTGRTPLRAFPRQVRRRLACATALHLDADILLLDDVLGQDDVEFRQRCAQRIEHEVARGLTVVLASDRPEILDRLCQTALWLEDGKSRVVGPAAEVAERYQAERGEAKRARLNSMRAGGRESTGAAQRGTGFEARIIAANVHAAQEGQTAGDGTAELLEIEVLVVVPTTPAELQFDLRRRKRTRPIRSQPLAVTKSGTYRARAMIAPPARLSLGADVRVVQRTRLPGGDDRVSESGPLAVAWSGGDWGSSGDGRESEVGGEPDSLVWELEYVGSWTFTPRAADSYAESG